MRETLAVVLMLAASGCTAQPPHEAVHAATLRLEVPGGICSGTAVGRSVILSASHCFADGKPATIRANGELCEVWKLQNDGNDHALLTVGGCEFAVTAKLGKPAKVGERIFTWSNPHVFRDLLIFGTVAGYTPGELIDAQTTLFDLNNTNGSSGAGIFNERGQLVAVVSIGTRPYRLMGSFPIVFTAKQWKDAGT